MNNQKNFISALVLQFFSIIQGLILPRLIVTTFGSDVNGLVSSITQFLSFISLLEGGVGTVVLAELYKPIEENDINHVRSILFACRNLFKKLTYVFICYTIVLSIVYSVCVLDRFNYLYTASLIVILSFATLLQYLFAISNKLLLQALQKIYIVNVVMTITVVLNLAFTVVVILVFPEIHLIKLLSSIAYLVQPIAFSFFVEKKFKIYDDCNKGYILKNRWSGFAQNIAYFINMNTDIVVITIFASLSDVSVYTIYMLAINALRSIIVSVTNSYQGALGKYYAESDSIKLKTKFCSFEEVFWVISVSMFATCLLMINSFVGIYTKGITDANYFQPVFALIIVIANMIYCVREPYRIMILSAGKFKETNFGSIAEAIINLGLSIVLVQKYGLIGVAIGTLVAITYRMIYFICFLKKDVLYLPYKRYFKFFTMFATVLIINISLYNSKIFRFNEFGHFLISAAGVFICEICVSWILLKIFGYLQKQLLKIE